ncbi:MAG: acyl-CoA dehydrogenase family protein [Acidimicrobiia bacterium]
MDLDLPPEAVAAGDGLRTFLASIRGATTEASEPDAYPADAFARLARAGYAAPHWPEPWGRNASPAEQVAIDAVLRDEPITRPFNPIGLGWAGPTLLVAGSGAQQEKWLPGILDGSEFWCQLFSEPGAGSDLASLATRAERDGDSYLVNGQKIWTTFADGARFGILLARTDPDATKHDGISYFVVDMESDGIEIRPIRQMTGAADFNEVFFTDLRIPAENLVGREHDGWRLAKVTLGNERVSLSGEGALWGIGPTAHDLMDLVRRHGGVDDPTLRQQLADLYTEAEILRLIRLRTASAQIRGLEPGPEASVRKAISDEHGQKVFDAALRLAGTDGVRLDAGPFGDPDTTWTSGFLFSPALTIGGGTAEVQRNIIGERVLGLPREPAT